MTARKTRRMDRSSKAGGGSRKRPTDSASAQPLAVAAPKASRLKWGIAFLAVWGTIAAVRFEIIDFPPREAQSGLWGEADFLATTGFDYKTLFFEEPSIFDGGWKAYGISIVPTMLAGIRTLCGSVRAGRNQPSLLSKDLLHSGRNEGMVGELRGGLKSNRNSGISSMIRWLIHGFMSTGLWVLVVTGSSLAADAEKSGDWPQFRGPEALGTADSPSLPDASLPDTWSDTENVRWKQPLEGRGWSSPIVWGQRVFVTAVASQGQTEKPKPGLYFGGERPQPPAAVHQWKVYCLDLESGRVLWERVAHEGRPASSIHLKNSFASETPATDGKRVFAYFGNLGVFCFDVDSTPVWNKKIGPYRTSSGWGTGASPVVYGDRLYILNDNEEDSFLLALDTASGDEVWRVKRDDRSNWATPFVWKNDLRTEIIASGTGKVRSYGLDGKQLWELGGLSNNAIPTPFAQFGWLYVASGHVLGPHKPVMAVRPGASGDITLGDRETANDYIVWCQKGASPYNPSPLLYGDYLYVLLDGGFFACYDAKTGKEIYSKKRIPDGRAFTASPWAYNGQIFCLNEFGVTFVIQAGPEFKILRTNPLGEDDMCLASPAIVGNKLLLRNDAAVYCIERGARLAKARR